MDPVQTMTLPLPPERPAELGGPAAPAAPVKGLGIAGGAKRPGAKKTAAPAASSLCCC